MTRRPRFRDTPGMLISTFYLLQDGIWVANEARNRNEEYRELRGARDFPRHHVTSLQPDSINIVVGLVYPNSPMPAGISA